MLGRHAHCSVALSSHASMAPLLSLSNRAKASRQASISSLDKLMMAFPQMIVQALRLVLVAALRIESGGQNRSTSKKY